MKLTCEVYEKLLTVKESPVTTGKNLNNIFVSIMEVENLNWKEEIVNQSYDRASNIRDYYTSLQAYIIKKTYKQYFFGVLATV